MTILSRRLSGVFALLAAAAVLSGATGKGCAPAPVGPVAPVDPPVAGPVAHWPFDELTGEIAADLSMGCYDCALDGPTWAPGVRGGALHFDGAPAAGHVVDDAGAVPAAIGDLTEGTIAVWLRVDAVTNGDDVPLSLPVLYMGQAEGGPRYGLHVYVGHDTLEDENGRHVYFTVVERRFPTLCFHTEESLSLGVWYHYAVVVAPGDHRVYLDGREVGRVYTESTPASHEFFASVPPGERDILTIGYGGLLDDEHSSFNGDVDDLRIYDRPLTAEEIEALAAPTEPPPVVP